MTDLKNFNDISFLSEEEIEESLQKNLSWLMEEQELWVFAAGSLIWNQGFENNACCRAYAPGWRRRFSLYSVHYRGTLKKPGLVVGLVAGGCCTGLGFRITSRFKMIALRALWQRELVTNAYLPRRIHVRLEGIGMKSCLAFVLNKFHPQYADFLSDEKRSHMIIEAEGVGGSNLDYLHNVSKSLQQHKLHCSHTNRLMLCTSRIRQG